MLVIPTIDRCPGCRATAFVHDRVIWPELAAAWELTAAELETIDAQQGLRCRRCGMALRGMALATAMMRAYGRSTCFVHFMARHPLLRVLEINEADGLHRYLRRMPRHRLVAYPEVDMTDLPFPDGAFDVVVHSDTLEHVGDPVRGLAETRRVLRRGGVACYTVPLVVGRLTRRRDDRPPSYHGTEATPAFLVHTEYGADAWTEPLRAGFRSCEVVAFGYPAGIALVARP